MRVSRVLRNVSGEWTDSLETVLHLWLPESCWKEKENCEMRRDWCVLAGFVLSCGLATSAAQQQTVPPGQQPPQQQQRTRPPAEPVAASSEGAAGKQKERVAAPEEKSSVTHHSARIGGQTINYT